MSLWSEYLARKLIFDNHPSLHDARCLNRLQRRCPCTACTDVCTESAISMDDGGEPEADWNACSGCGLCVSACPVRAVAPARLQTERILASLDPNSARSFSGQQKDITISCVHGPGNSFYTEYPGSLPWELLCFLALQGRVILLTGDCVNCEKETCRSSLQQNIGLAMRFFGNTGTSSLPAVFSDEDAAKTGTWIPKTGTSTSEAGTAHAEANALYAAAEKAPSSAREPDYAANIILTQDPAAVAPRKYTRRQAFSLAAKRTGRAAGSLLPALQESIPDGTIWRQLLIRRLEQIAKSGNSRDFLWNLPAFTEKCTACGICARLCPCKAIVRAPGPEGSGRFYMALLPGKCTGCGMCTDICPEKALSAPVPVPLPAPVRPRLHPVAAVPCARCGEPVPAGSGSALCVRCRAESRT
ncbi:MAG: 4Fe-4S binding protein [Eubacteriales bacterium]|nr:4Fe-4S binding protein [Eubacteriales bacterium]